MLLFSGTKHFSKLSLTNGKYGLLRILFKKFKWNTQNKSKYNSHILLSTRIVVVLKLHARHGSCQYMSKLMILQVIWLDELWLDEQTPPSMQLSQSASLWVICIHSTSHEWLLLVSSVLASNTFHQQQPLSTAQCGSRSAIVLGFFHNIQGISGNLSFVVMLRVPCAVGLIWNGASTLVYGGTGAGRTVGEGCQIRRRHRHHVASKAKDVFHDLGYDLRFWRSIWHSIFWPTFGIGKPLWTG